jgi:alpha-1,3-rhamnosyl/mannosyltransferase
MQYKRFPQDLGFVARWTTEVLVQMAARRADHILTISEFSKREILELTRANADHITVTPLAADPAFSVPVAGEAEVPKPYLLCVANSYPHKNVDQLIRAFTELEEAIPHTLVWIGKPRLGEGAVQKALSGLRNPKRVVRLSGLRRSELIRLYQQADLFVFPSLYEGFGLPVLESFLAGAPIVANPCGSITEVGGGVIEFVTCISDAGWAETITRVLTWPSEERRSRVNAGFNRAAGFHWESCAGMTIAVLEKKMPSAEKKGY